MGPNGKPKPKARINRETAWRERKARKFKLWTEGTEERREAYRVGSFQRIVIFEGNGA